MPEPLKRASESPALFSAFNMLVYGDAGTGKTYFAGTFGSDTLYINIGAGIITLRSPHFVNKHGIWDPFLFTPVKPEDDLTGPIKNRSVAVQVRDFIEDHIEDDRIKTLIIDDATSLQNIFMLQALDYNWINKKSQTKAELKTHKAVIPAIQDWGTQMSFIESFIITFTELCASLNKNFIVLAHAKYFTKPPDKPTGNEIITSIKPNFTGDKNRISGYFDMVWYSTVVGAADQAKYRMTTSRTEIIEAKTRWGGLFPLLYDNPTYEDIKKKITAHNATIIAVKPL